MSIQDRRAASGTMMAQLVSTAIPPITAATTIQLQVRSLMSASLLFRVVNAKEAIGHAAVTQARPLGEACQPAAVGEMRAGAQHQRAADAAAGDAAENGLAQNMAFNLDPVGEDFHRDGGKGLLVAPYTLHYGPSLYGPDAAGGK